MGRKPSGGEVMLRVSDYAGPTLSGGRYCDPASRRDPQLRWRSDQPSLVQAPLYLILEPGPSGGVYGTHPVGNTPENRQSANKADPLSNGNLLLARAGQIGPRRPDGAEVNGSSPVRPAVLPMLAPRSARGGPADGVGTPWLVGFTAHAISCGADKEVEVGTRVGLLDVIYIEALPAAYGIGEACEGSGVGSADPELLLRYL
jgi:hypothetical protein